MLKYKVILPLILLLGILLTYFNVKERTFDDESITLGLSLPRSGIMHTWGDAVYAGANAYFTYANEQQLLNKKITLLTLDDKYEPELTLENVQHFRKKDIFAFFAFVGTPTSKKIFPILKDSDIPFVAPFTGASFLRGTPIKNIINFRPSYQDEINAIVQYLYTKKKIRKFAVFYQNDDYGEEGYVSLLHTLKKHKLTLQGEGAYKRNTLSITHAFREIKKSKPQAILMIGANRANTLFIKTARKDKNFEKTIFCNISFGNADAMVKGSEGKTDNLLFSQVVPYYDKKNIPVLTEYKNIMHSYGLAKKLGFISLESFLAAKSVVDALKKIQDHTTRSNFIEALKRLPQDTLEGMRLKFENNQLLNSIYIFEYKNNHFKEVYHED